MFYSGRIFSLFAVSMFNILDLPYNQMSLIPQILIERLVQIMMLLQRQDTLF